MGRKRKDTELVLSKELIEAELYKRSFYQFFKAAWHLLEPVPFQENWHFEYICERFQELVYGIKEGKKGTNVILNLPFRSGKSNILILFRCWIWVVCPWMSIISASYASSLSIEHNRKARNIMRSDWFQKRFGYIVIQNDLDLKSEVGNTDNGVMLATSVTSSVIGRGGHILLLDDPQDASSVTSEILREQVINWYNDTFFSRYNDPFTVCRILVQQRLHEEDLTGYLLDKSPELYEHICIPAELTPEANLKPIQLITNYDDNLFWKSRFSQTALNEFKSTLGAYAYAGQLQQLPAPDGGSVLKKDWFNIISESEFNDMVVGKRIVWNAYIDPAYTSDKKNDPSAILIASYIDGKLFIKNVFQKWLEFPDLLKFIVNVSIDNLTKDSKVYIEPKASGKSIVQALKDQTNLNVCELPSPKDSKETRVNSISPFVESKRVYLLRNLNWNNLFLDEVSAFPNGRHDDIVDCLAHAVEHNNKSNKGLKFFFLK